MTGSKVVKQAMDARAKKLVDAYLDMRNTTSDICDIMGWTTTVPNTMVNKEIYRLRKRGYDIPYRSGMRPKKKVD